MSKRVIFPQHNGERKKAKLDITISDHNFPLSQNRNSVVNNVDADTWGDDCDDEMLIFASQACEQAYSNDNISSLPDFTICMQPSSTSTQLSNNPVPSTSKTEFAFKKPTTNAPSYVSTHLKDKFNRVSTPLAGLCSNIVTKTNKEVNLSDDLILNEKVYKDEDPQYIYHQLIQLQEEHAKLKSENTKLFEKCLTKEGEASILRTQLKTYQIATDNARLEKIKAQEQIQMEWTKKLSTANNQLTDLKTQLEFKNMEVINLKERTKILESSKVKLTQNFPGVDISSGPKHSRSITTNSCALSTRKVKVASSTAQTDNRAHIIKLNNTLRTKHSKLNKFLPLILEPNMDQRLCLLDYNEKLRKTMNYSQNNCRIVNTFHRLPSTPAPSKEKVNKKICLRSIHEDLTHIAVNTGEVTRNRYINVFKSVHTALIGVSEELQMIKQRFTTAFQREIDEKYIEATSTFLTVEPCDLLRGRNLYKEEQAVSARRMAAILACVLESSKCIEIFKDFEEDCLQTHEKSSEIAHKERFVEVISRICNLLYSTSCGMLYSGLLLSVITLIEILFKHTDVPTYLAELVEIVKRIILSRPMTFVSCYLWELMRKMSVTEGFLSKFCPDNISGNLRLDNEQGVLLYKTDSCLLQILLKQTEAGLKCIDKQNLQKEAMEVATNLIAFYGNSNYVNVNVSLETARCDCHLVLLEVIVYALRICAFMLHDTGNGENPNRVRLTAICHSGVTVLHRCLLAEPQLGMHLSDVAGLVLELITVYATFQTSDTYKNMLSGLSAAFQTATEETPPPYHSQAWMESFDALALVDD